MGFGGGALASATWLYQNSVLILQPRRPRASALRGSKVVQPEGKWGEVGCAPTDASEVQASLLYKPWHITLMAASSVFGTESSLGGRNVFCRERFGEGQAERQRQRG